MRAPHWVNPSRLPVTYRQAVLRLSQQRPSIRLSEAVGVRGSNRRSPLWRPIQDDRDGWGAGVCCDRVLASRKCWPSGEMSLPRLVVARLQRHRFADPRGKKGHGVPGFERPVAWTCPNRNRHQPAIQRDVEQFLAITPPTHLTPPFVEICHLLPRTGKRLDVNLSAARFIRLVRDPLSVRIELPVLVRRNSSRTTGNGFRLPSKRQRPDVSGFLRDPDC